MSSHVPAQLPTPGDDLLRAAFDATADGILIVGQGGRILEANHRFIELWRVPAELVASGDDGRLLGFALEQLVDGPAFVREVERLYATDTEQTDTIHFKDGRIFERYTRAVRRTGERARLWSFRDVTAQHLTAAQLQRERAHFAALIRSSPDMVWLKDPDGVYLACNPVFERLYAAPEEKILGHNDLDFVSPELAAFFRENDLQAVKAGGPRVNEEWLTNAADGKRWLAETIKTPVFDGGGQLLGVLGVARDVTERQARVLAAQQSEAAFRAIFEGVGDAILVHHAETGAIIDVNTKMTEMYGVDRTKVASISADLLCEGTPPYSSQEAVGWLMRARGGETPVFEWLARRVDDRRTFWVEVSMRRAEIAGQDRILVLVRDISDRKAAEEKLRAALAEKDALLREIHHRVKNNLSVIISLIGLQAAEIQDRDTLRKLEDLQHRARAMALVHESLYRSTSLAEVDFGAYLRTLAGQVATAVATDPTVGVEVEATDVHLHIEQAVPCGLMVSEFLTNAFKYAFPRAATPGERTARVVRVEMRADQGLVTLTVADNGVGLPPGLDWENTRSLGLQVVRVLARQMGARVEMRGAPGTSCRVTFREKK